MAVRFMESFDGVLTYEQLVNGKTGSDYPNSGKWVRLGSSNEGSLDSSGRTGRCLKVAAVSPSSDTLSTQFLNGGPEVFVGFAFKAGTLSTSGATRSICQASNEQGNPAIRLRRIDGDLRLETFSNVGTGSTRWTVSDVFTSADEWYYIEFRLLMGNSGTVEVRVDNTPTGSTFTGNVRGTSNGLRFGSFLPFSGTAAANDRMDDLYIADPTGLYNNSFLGNQRVHCLRPNANGSKSEWTGSDLDQVDNYLLVNEQDRDNATYVQATTNGDTDLYTFDEPSSVIGTIRAVQMVTQQQATNPADLRDTHHILKTGNAERWIRGKNQDTALKEAWSVMDGHAPAGLYAYGGGHAFTADHVSLDITGSFDLRWAGLLPDWNIQRALNAWMVSKWGGNDNSYIMFWGFTTGAERLNVGYTFDGTGGTSEFAIVTQQLSQQLTGISDTGVVQGSYLPFGFRVTRNTSNGTRTFFWRHIDPYSPETALTTIRSNTGWTTWQTITGGTTGAIHAGSNPLRVGNPGGGPPMISFAAIVMDGIAGTEVANPNFAAQTDGSTGFTDAAGRDWELSGDAKIYAPGGSRIIEPADFTSIEWGYVQVPRDDL